MKIGEVADQLGLRASAIRYYEKTGLIDPPSRVSGKRRFDDRTINLLKFVQLAQAAGFTIAEIKTLIDGYEMNSRPGALWRTLALEKKQQIQQKLADLENMDRVLDKFLECKCASLNECVSDASAANHSPKRRPMR